MACSCEDERVMPARVDGASSVVAPAPGLHAGVKGQVPEWTIRCRWLGVA